MKKNFNNAAKGIFLGLVAATSVTMTSCNDDNEFANVSTQPAVSSPSDPLGCGYNTIATDMLNLGEVRIPVNSNNISISNSNPKFQYHVESKGGKFFIRPHFSGTNDIVENDVLHISANDSKAEKNIFVSVSEETPVTRGIEVENPTTADKVVATLAKGLIPGKVAPEAQAEKEIFNPRKIMKLYDDASKESYDFLDIRDNVYSNYFYETAKNHNEVIKTEAKSLGFNLKVPTGGLNIGLGVDGHNNESTKRIEEKETALYGWKTRTATGSLNATCLKNYINKLPEANTAEMVENYADAIMKVDGNYDRDQLITDLYKPLALQSLMSPSVNDMLNNPASFAYQGFQNTKESLKKLITQYGMYVSTSCQMGGMARTTLTKDSNSKECGIEWAIKVVADASMDKTVEQTEKQDTKDEKNGRVVSRIMKSLPATPSFNISFEKSSNVKDILNTMHVEYQTQCWGGNGVKDIDKWEVNASNPKEWVCISYAPTFKNDNGGFGNMDTDNTNNTGFIPLWKLCIDPERRAILRQLIEPDANNQIGYFNYVKEAKKVLVIADVQLKVYDGRDHKDSDFKPYYAKDNRGMESKSHLYIPLRHNQYGFEENRVVNFANWKVAVKKESHNKYITHSMVPFVAYEWVYEDDIKNGKDFTGITALRVVDVNNRSGIERADEKRTFEIVTGNSDYHPNGEQKLMITYASTATPLEKRITGVGFQYTKGGDYNKVFASSIGTDWDRNFADSKERYDYFWGDKTFINHDVAKGTNILKALEGWIFRTEYTPEKTIYPCATTRPIADEVKAQMAQVKESFANL